MRKWLLASVAVVGLVPASLRAQAPPLDLPVGGTIVGPMISAPFTAGDITGIVSEVVLAGDTTNPLGGLDFIYQVTASQNPPPAGGGLATLAVNSYIGFPNTVAQTDPTAFNALYGTTFTPVTANGVSTSSSGSSITGATNTVNFFFTDTAPIETNLVIVQTSATSFDSNGYVDLIDSHIREVDSFYEPAAATPEPTSLLILFGVGGTFASFKGASIWRRRRNGVALA